MMQPSCKVSTSAEPDDWRPATAIDFRVFAEDNCRRPSMQATFRVEHPPRGAEARNGDEGPPQRFAWEVALWDMSCNKLSASRMSNFFSMKLAVAPMPSANSLQPLHVQ